MTYLLIPLVLAVLMLCGYLAACAGAERWLSLREWWGTKKRTAGVALRPAPADPQRNEGGA